MERSIFSADFPQGSGYRVKDGYVEIIGGIKLKIIGRDRRYDQYENREARLVYKEGRMILWISKRIPRPKQNKPRDAIAIDINERKIVYGNHKICLLYTSDAADA